MAHFFVAPNTPVINLPPVWAVDTPATLNFPSGGGSYNFGLKASDPHPWDEVSFLFGASAPSGYSINNTGLLTALNGAPNASLIIRARDLSGLYADHVCNVSVEAVAEDSYWSDAYGDAFNVYAGQPFSYTFQATNPSANPITFAYTPPPVDSPLEVTEHAQVGAIREITISSDGTNLVESNQYSISIDFGNPSSNALADWNARVAGPGVLWAHRFNDNSAMYWATVYGNGVHRPDLSMRQSTGGIIGDGYLRMFAPANVVTTGGFARPLAPVVGATPSGAWSSLPYPTDLNNAGRPTMDYNAFYSSVPGDPAGKKGNMVGGFFTHADYQDYTQAGNELWNPALRPGQIKSSDGTHFTGTDFYLQFRTRVPAVVLSTFNSKFLMIVNGGNGTPYHEIVSNFVPTIGSIFYFYTSQGNQTNSILWHPQGSSGAGTLLQPGADAPYGAQCVVPAGVNGRPALPLTGQCWAWPIDEWVTILVHVIPGHHEPNARYGEPSTWTHKDTGIEAWVATQSQIDAARNAGQTPQYTKIWDKKDYAFDYFGRYQFEDINGSTLSPNGWNLFNLTMFLNYSSSSAQSWPEDLWHDHDQIICSTQFIPCPVY